MTNSMWPPIVSANSVSGPGPGRTGPGRPAENGTTRNKKPPFLREELCLCRETVGKVAVNEEATEGSLSMESLNGASDV